ncbi:MAG: hypothetical protein QOC96_3677 [Acidobacteriota bacterium]|jgi:hypothetical protein|nr:hypothetical protein [Acidobacteriota bacterium]
MLKFIESTPELSSEMRFIRSACRNEACDPTISNQNILARRDFTLKD